MMESKDFKSIDELFKNTLENLPDTPSASGWDAPSPEVWQSIQTNLAKPSGSSGLMAKILGATALVVGVGAAVVFFRGSGGQQAQPDATPTAPVQQIVPEPAVNQHVPTTTVPTGELAKPSSTNKTTRPAAAPTATSPTPEKHPEASQPQPVTTMPQPDPTQDVDAPRDLPVPAAPAASQPAKVEPPAEKPKNNTQKNKSTAPMPPNNLEKDKAKQQSGGGGL